MHYNLVHWLILLVIVAFWIGVATFVARRVKGKR